MALRIDSVKTITLTSTSTTDVDVNYRAFKIQNTHSENKVYVKEKGYDNVDVTADSGWAIAPGKTEDGVFRAKTLSLKASGASTVCKILFVDEE